MTAPTFRAVDQHTGERAFDYDQLVEENTSLKAERSELYRQLEQRFEIATRIDELTAERDDLAERLANLDEAHQITLGMLAQARRDVNTYRAALAVTAATS